MKKKLEDITRQEWIAFNWVELEQTFGDEGRIFMAESRRTPFEAAQAMQDWNATIDAFEVTKESEL